MIEITKRELTLVWFSLLVEQRKHAPNSSKWFMYEKIICKIETELGPAIITSRYKVERTNESNN